MIEIFFFLTLLIFYYLLTKASTEIIKFYMKQKGMIKESCNSCTPCKETSYALNDNKVSESIGNIERILYFIGVISNNWTLVTIVVAVKTIARYKKLDEQDFAEKFIIGSLSSLLLAIIFAYINIAIMKQFEMIDLSKPVFENTLNIKIVDINVSNVKTIIK